jgi:hypothetical protein
MPPDSLRANNQAETDWDDATARCVSMLVSFVSVAAAALRRLLTRNRVCTLPPTVAQPPRMFIMTMIASVIIGSLHRLL